MEKVWMWLAWRLPRKLMYWATIRAASIATTGEWAGEETPAVPVIEVLKRIGY